MTTHSLIVKKFGIFFIFSYIDNKKDFQKSEFCNQISSVPVNELLVDPNELLVELLVAPCCPCCSLQQGVQQGAYNKFNSNNIISVCTIIIKTRV